MKEDVPAMLAIYAPFVERTAVSFEYDVPSLPAFEARFDAVTARYPWLVWEQDGRVQGYAYANVALSRAGYQWCADVTIYLAPQAQHTGAGHALYSCLERVMAQLGYRWLYALVSASNERSCRFHEHRGYTLQGRFRRCAWKLGKWHDLNWYGLALCDDAPPDAPPAPFTPEAMEGAFGG